MEANKFIRNKKCPKCKCWRSNNEFIRRDKQWKQCNQCAKFNSKYQTQIRQKTKCMFVYDSDSDESG